MNTQTRQLHDFIKRYCYEEGDFTLSSGRKSKYYINLRKLLVNPKYLGICAEAMFWLIFNHLNELFIDKINYRQFFGIGGLELSGIPLATAIAGYGEREVAHDEFFNFFVRKKKKRHGLENEIELPANIRLGTPAVVVDDVITSGASVLQAYKSAECSGLDIKGIFSVVDREEGAKDLIESTFDLEFNSLFTISDFQK